MLPAPPFDIGDRMDEATKLVFELQMKLAALDHKVTQYQRDMSSEFTKYAEDLLRDVPKDVSADVSKRIAESMKDYRSLNLRLGTVESCANATGSSNSGGAERSNAKLLVPVHLGDTQVEEEERPRSPHEREKEFQGVFTPSYLPLLDSTDRHERRASYDSKTTTPPELKGKDMDMEALHADASTGTRSLAGASESFRPQPERRNTDEVSTTSTDSIDGVIRRSALRRSSSSSNKASPRRVRFDVEGEEVLPTSSPYTSQLCMAKDLPTSYQTLEDDLDEEVGAEQIEDMEEEERPTKRISSSQALRVLSRSPFADDGTEWTTVTAPPDGSASIAISGIPCGGGYPVDSSTDNLPIANENPRDLLDNSEPLSISLTSIIAITKEKLAHQAVDSEIVAMPSHSSHSNQDIEPERDREDFTDSDADEDFIAMAPRKSTKSSHSFRTSTSFAVRKPTISGTGKPVSSDGDAGRLLDMNSLDLFKRGEKAKMTSDADRKLSFSRDSDDGLFTFEENDNNTREKSFSPPEHEDSPSDDDSSTSLSAVISKAASAPIQPLGREITQSVNRDNAFPSFSGTVTGSYSGKKLIAFSNPVVSPEVHKQAASVGNYEGWFVGSVHGRSGVDDSDPTAFRASIGSRTYDKPNKPKTMQERLAWEHYHDDKATEATAEAANAARTEQDAKKDLAK